MVLRSLVDIERVIRASWSEQTCDPVDRAEWSTDNPARGQCAATALVVQDLLGGELLLAEVRNADGSRQGVHYWNRLANGVEVDLTREQFTPTEIVQAPAAIARPADTSRGRLAAQYEALASAVRGRLREVSLRPLTESNRHAVEALRVSPSQERFVSSVVASLHEAAEHPDARAMYWGVYSEDTPVGFVMIADEVAGPEYIPQYLWKLLIDERYQRQGFGTATLDLIVEYFRGRPGVEVLTTSAGEGDGSPIEFYERYGFERTGEVSDGEVVLRLRLR